MVYKFLRNTQKFPHLESKTVHKRNKKSSQMTLNERMGQTKQEWKWWRKYKVFLVTLFLTCFLLLFLTIYSLYSIIFVYIYLSIQFYMFWNNMKDIFFFFLKWAKDRLCCWKCFRFHNRNDPFLCCLFVPWISFFFHVVANKLD